MLAKIHVIFYSLYGHTHRLADAVALGARKTSDVVVNLFRVSEISGLLPKTTIQSSDVLQAQKAFEHLPIAQPEHLIEADAVIFGTPAHFGGMCAQMRNFLDQVGDLGMSGALIGKVGSVFTSVSSQHGGHETTITNFHTTLLHLGFVVVGVPPNEKRLMTMEEITGGSPYGASTLAGTKGNRMPSENELLIGRAQGLNVAKTAKWIKLGRNIASD